MVTILGYGLSVYDNLTCRIAGRHIVAVKGGTGDSSGIFCLTPAHSPGLVFVDILESTTLQLVSESKASFTFHEDIRVDMVYPSHGPTDGGTIIDVYGSGFVDGLSLRFGDIGPFAACSFQSIVQLRCSSPPSLNHITVDLVWSAYNGSVSTVNHSFLFYFPVHITSIQPSLGISGDNTKILIVGQNFFPFASLQCRVGVEHFPALQVSNSMIECVIAVARQGTYPVTLNILSAVSTGGSVDFEVVQSGRIFQMIPTKGCASGGDTVTLTGTMLDHRLQYTCSFGMHRVISLALSSTLLACAAPALGKAQNVVLSVLAGAGGLRLLSAPFEFVSAPPSFTSLQPSRSSVGKLSTIFLVGGIFDRQSVMYCRIGSFGRTQLRHITSTLVTCAVGLSSPGTYSLVVVFQDQVVGGPFELEVLQDVTISRIQPTLGFVGRGQIFTIFGQGFSDSPNLTCSFGGRETAIATWLSYSQLTCHLHRGWHEGSMDVDVSSDGLHFTGRAHTVTMKEQVLLVSLQPSSGHWDGGYHITVTTSLSVPDYRIRIRCGLGKAFSDAKKVTSDQLSCMAPRGTPGLVSFALVTSDGTQISQANLSFEYLPDAILSAIVPKSGPVGGGTAVSMIGTFFAASATCVFGNTRTSAALHVSSTLAICLSPAAVEPGAFTISLSNSHIPAAVGGIGERRGLEFVYNLPMTLIIAFPNSGPAKGGTTVTLIGSGFSLSIYDCNCRFGVNYWGPPHFVTSSVVECAVGEHSPGNVSIGISREGVDLASIAQGYRFVAACGILAVIPSYGPSNVGIVLTVYGYGFASFHNFECKFNGSFLSMSKFISSSILFCKTKPHFSGKGFLDIVSEVGFITERFNFHFLSSPLLQELFPYHIPENRSIVLSFKLSNARAPVYCVFTQDLESFTAGASTQSSDFSIFKCLSPKLNSGSVSMHIISDGVESNILSLTVYHTSSIFSINPSSVPGVRLSLVTLVGVNFRHGGVCKCAKHIFYVTFLSTTAVICQIPLISKTGFYTVHLYYDQNEFEEDWVTVFVNSLGPLRRVSPSIVSGHRGAILKFQGGPFDSRINPLCFFGSNTKQERVPAVFLSSFSIGCASPHSATGQMIVCISLYGQNSCATDPFEFLFVNESRLDAVRPTSAYAGQTTLITLIGKGFHNSISFCTIERNIQPSSVISSSFLVCVLPAQIANVEVYVSLQSGNDFPEQDIGVPVHFVPKPIVQSVLPSFGFSNVFQFISLVGTDFAEKLSYKCFFGSYASETDCTWFSRTLIECDVPFLNPGNFSIFVQVSSMVPCTTPLKFLVSAVLLYSLSPSTGPTNGGTVISISGSGFDKLLSPYCQTSNSSLVSTLLSQSLILCLMPSHTVGSLPVGLMADNWAQDNHSFTFRYYLKPRVLHYAPSSGFAHSGQSVFVTLANVPESLKEAECVFGSISVKGQQISENKTACNLPSVPVGMIAVFLHWQSTGLRSEEFIFEVRSFFNVLSMSSSSGPSDGGELIFFDIDGAIPENWSVFCHFGRLNHSALLFSATNMTCIAPPHPAGIVMVSFSCNGVPIINQSLNYLFLESKIVSLSLRPRHGPVSGGTRICVDGFCPSNESSFVCVFGSLTTFAFCSLKNALCCRSPQSRQAGAVAFRLQRDGLFLTKHSSYTYYLLPEIKFIRPSFGPLDGVKVIIYGNYFSPSENLTCKFGIPKVPAIFISSTSIYCNAPSNAPGLVYLEV